MSKDSHPPAEFPWPHDPVHLGPFPPPIGEVRPNELERKTALVVDDEEGVRRLFQKLLTDAGYHVRLAHDGAAALEAIASHSPVRPIVRHHHEHLDGSGYPDGLQGNHVPLLAQIAGIVDTYEALTTERPYQRAVAPPAAFDSLRQHVRRGWRREDLVEQFVSVIDRLHTAS